MNFRLLPLLFESTSCQLPLVSGSCRLAGTFASKKDWIISRKDASLPIPGTPLKLLGCCIGRAFILFVPRFQSCIKSQSKNRNNKSSKRRQPYSPRNPFRFLCQESGQFHVQLSMSNGMVDYVLFFFTFFLRMNHGT